MGRIISKQDRMAEQSAHAGQNQYRIFFKDSAGIKHIVQIFWAKDDVEAKNELDIYNKKIQLIDPENTTEYFYGTCGNIIHDLGNGMEEVFDDFGEELKSDENETALEKIKIFFMKFAWWFRDLKYAFVDFWYWFKHYDKTTNKSHQRFESWNLDSAVLDMLEFNIPIIIKSKNGIPNDFCLKARQKLHENDSNFDVNLSLQHNPNPSKDEMNLAEQMWDNELNTVLKHIKLYRYYSNFGIIDDNDSGYVEIDSEYKNTIPYKPGTDKSLDYEKMHILTQKEWNTIWDWWKQYGQSCWT